MKNIAFLCLLIYSSLSSTAGIISGKVTNDNGQPLAYASVFIKGTTIGTITNQQGNYSLEITNGSYTVVAQYIGYNKEEKAVHVTESLVLNFTLTPQQLTLSDVEVTAGGEDRAYAIMRKAISKREEYNNALPAFTCDAYIKTLLETQKLPGKILGQKIPEDDKKKAGLDSTGKGIVYLSESVTRIAFQQPDKVKLQVVSGKESGTNGYGFNFPVFINFYENNINLLTNDFTPRGFISPLADNALNFYKCHYLGFFTDSGRKIYKIQLAPQRKYEPVFSGIINITDGDWRIYSLDLFLTAESELELIDSFEITQVHVPVANNIWRTKDQVIHARFNQFGIKASGDFLNIYSNYNTQPQFAKDYFNNVIISYDTAVNKKPDTYWDTARPVPLKPQEAEDYVLKDSLVKAQKDSVMAAIEKINVRTIFFSGFSRNNYLKGKSWGIDWKPLLFQLNYNTVEGFVQESSFSINHLLKNKNTQLSFIPNVRYGFNNRHFNAWASLQWNHTLSPAYLLQMDPDSLNQLQYKGVFTVSGGKRVSQFNENNPISQFSNSTNTLFFNRNYMKIYEDWFAELNYQKKTVYGFSYNLNLVYEDRIPLNNTTDFSIIKYDSNAFTPNYPVEKISSQFTRHQAVVGTIKLSYQPGQKLIQYPHSFISLGSVYPTFTLEYRKGFTNILSSDEDFDAWDFTIADNLNFKLYGTFKYRLEAGGFLNDKSVYIQDYQHFPGNRLLLAGKYLYTLQTADYYTNSTTAPFYFAAFAEHHFNGFITNKIPLLRKLKWNLVAGGDVLTINKNENFYEVYGGLENIFKLMRVDFVNGWQNNRPLRFSVKFTVGGLIGGKIDVSALQ